MRISVFGLGYVGCVTAVCLAKAGHSVVAVELNPDKVAMVNACIPPIVEPGFPETLTQVVGAGRLRATESAAEAMGKSDLALICVGTPSRTNGELDVDAVRRVGEQIGEGIRGSDRPFTVVLRSTVLPGTTDQVLRPALGRGATGSSTAGIHVAVNPEFMREGSALRDFTDPPFTLIGSDDPEASSGVEALYAAVRAPVVRTTIRTAEMVKYACNAFHALKICFANELGELASSLGADPQDVMRIFRMDQKLNISGAYLRPGFAYGGSCLPKDLRALLSAARLTAQPIPLLSAIPLSNEHQIRRGIEMVLQTGKRRVGLVGLAFKSGTDDLRESPMVTLAEALIGKGRDVRIYDPSVSLARLIGANRRYIEQEIPHIASLMCETPAELLTHAEVIVVGNPGAEAAHVLAEVGSHQVVVDLSQGSVMQSLCAEHAQTREECTR